MNYHYHFNPDKIIKYSQIFLQFLQQCCDVTISELLFNEGSPTEHYPLEVNFLELANFSPKLAGLLITHSSKMIPIFDECIISAQEQMKTEFPIKRNCHVRIGNLPLTQEITKNALPKSSDIGSFMCFEGTVIRVSAVKMLESEKTFECAKCKHRFQLTADITRYNLMEPPKTCPSNRRKPCRSRTFEEVSDSHTLCKDYQEIKIQEHFGKLEVGAVPRSMIVILEDDLADMCKAGDDIFVTGLVLARWRTLIPKSKCDLEIVIRANHVHINNPQLSSLDLSEEIKTQFHEFWESYLPNPLAGRNLILSSMCPQVYGLSIVKLALGMVLVGGVSRFNAETGHKVRGEPHLLIVGDPGTGKCFAKNTQILMFNGKNKMIQYIKPGDLLMGDDSQPRIVNSISKGFGILYRILLNDYSSFVVNGNHILCLQQKNNKNIIEMTVKKFLSLPKKDQNLYFMYKVPIKFPKKEIGQIPAYCFGFSLAKQKKYFGIDSRYKFNCSQIQEQFLQGVIDSIGIHISKLNQKFTIIPHKNKSFIDDIQFICNCLGISSEKFQIPFYLIQNPSKNSYFLKIDTQILSSKIDYKQRKLTRNLIKRKGNQNSRLFSFEIYSESYGNYYGVDVDSNKRFLLSNFIVTHNSQILKYASKLSARSVLTTGIGSTSAGLTVTAVKESGGEWSLEAGALVLADGGVCCIDEFDCIREHDRGTIHESMEQQTLSVAKAGMVCKLNTRTTVIAAANPKGKYDPTQSLSVNLAMASPLLSRFDIVLLLMDNENPDWDRRIASFILTERDNYTRNITGNQHSTPTKQIKSQNLTENLWNFSLIQSYISYIKDQFQPRFLKHSKEVLKRYYHRQRNSDTRNAARTTLRLLESLIRLAQAHSRLMFRDYITLQDAIMAVIVVDSSTTTSSLLGFESALHSTFPDDPENDYFEQKKIVLTKLGLENYMDIHNEVLPGQKAMDEQSEDDFSDFENDQEDFDEIDRVDLISHHSQLENANQINGLNDYNDQDEKALL